MPKRRQELSDKKLVERCLKGRQDAWTELFQRHHGALTSHVRHLLQGQANLRARAEDLAEDVLTSLWERDKQGMRAYRSVQASFRGYLCFLAFQAVRLESRRNTRRRKTQTAYAAHQHAGSQEDEAVMALFEEEFVARLPPRQQAFMRHVLLGEPDPSGLHKFSKKQAYDLYERILKKAQDFWKIDRGGVEKS